MTGKEFILYILENGLVDEPIFKDNNIAGLLTLDRAAAKLNVGMATVSIYASLGRIDSITVGDVIFIIDNDKLKPKGANG